MFIEDLIHRLTGSGSYLFVSPVVTIQVADQNILFSFSNQIDSGLALTQKQGFVAINLIKKYSRQLSVALNKDVSPFYLNPQFKYPIRVLNALPKTIRIVKKSANSYIIQLSFPYEESTVSLIKDYKKNISTNRLGHTINWNIETKTWDLDLREEHVDWISNNLMNLGFIVDQEFIDFVDQIQDVKSNLENYIPMVRFSNNNFEYKNVSKNIPQPTSTDLVDVLVDARKYGISTWTEDIDVALTSLNLNPFLYRFLTTPTLTAIPSEKEKLTISDIGSIIQWSLPCLIIIPGGTEFKHIEFCYPFLKKIGIADNEMSVMFRLDKDRGADFNDFVKNHKINNPISDQTKIVFISGKVPKPLVESKMNFSTIFNLGISGVHYTLSAYIKNHHFVINYTLKEEDFANV